MHFVLSRVSSVNLLSDRRKRKPHFFPLPHSSLKSSHLNSTFTSPSCWLYKICIPAQRGNDTWVVYIAHPGLFQQCCGFQARLLCFVQYLTQRWPGLSFVQKKPPGPQQLFCTLPWQPAGCGSCSTACRAAHRCSFSSKETCHNQFLGLALHLLLLHKEWTKEHQLMANFPSP